MPSLWASQRMVNCLLLVFPTQLVSTIFLSSASLPGTVHSLIRYLLKSNLFFCLHFHSLMSKEIKSSFIQSQLASLFFFRTKIHKISYFRTFMSPFWEQYHLIPTRYVGRMSTLSRLFCVLTIIAQICKLCYTSVLSMFVLG